MRLQSTRAGGMAAGHMRTWRRIGAAVLALLVAFLAVTLLALEGREVVVVRSFAPDGTVTETRTWVADEDGFVWIEAANPRRRFYRDVVATGKVELRRGGRVARYDVAVMPNPQGHRHIRRLLAEKYGLADWWIGWLADTSPSLEIRLQPRADDGRGSGGSDNR